MYRIQIPADLPSLLNAAIYHFWETREGQSSRQEAHGIHDTGNRSAVTGGKQLDGFVELIHKLLINNNVPQECIYIDSNLELPGFYRPTKKWDLLVVDGNKLIIALEFKSQVGSSFGNNFNNRTEEAIGSALDLWTAYRDGIFGNKVAPWLGYFMLLEDCEKSNTPLSIRSPHFKIFPEFVNSSYKRRYEILCTKLLHERQYSAACFATTSYINRIANLLFPVPNLSFNNFILSMLSTSLAHFANLEY